MLSALWIALCLFMPRIIGDRGVTRSLMEMRKANVSGWSRLSHPPPRAARLHFMLALEQRNLDAAEDDLLSVSDPASPSFGQYFTPAEVVARYSPAVESWIAVRAWLNESGIPASKISRSRDASLVTFIATVEEGEALLETQYEMFASEADGSLHVSCEKYSLPSSLLQHVNFVLPTVHLGLGTKIASGSGREPAHKRSGQNPTILPAVSTRRRATQDCFSLITPDCLRDMYQLPLNHSGHANNSFGIYEQAWETWLPGDLDAFSTYSPVNVGRRPNVVPVDGGYQQTQFEDFLFNAEADLDFEYAMALASPQPANMINFQVGDVSGQGKLNNLLAAFDPFYCGALNASLDGQYPDPFARGYNSSDCGTLKQLPNVLSLSYAWTEADLPEAYVRRQCVELLKLGLMGVSVIAATSDCGPAAANCECVGGDTASGRFGPTSPASCPYVTAVGGTQLLHSSSNETMAGPGRYREEAFRKVYSSGTISTSGGGFSNVFSTPAWQAGATRGYLDREGDSLRRRNITSLFNWSGRGLPDVSANAADFAIALDGQASAVAGVSGSAPVFAAVVAILNDERLRAGKSPLGFMNPVLYLNPQIMNDVVSGSNYGCGVEAFNATVGWDPVTGLGSPNFPRCWNYT